MTVQKDYVWQDGMPTMQLSSKPDDRDSCIVTASDRKLACSTAAITCSTAAITIQSNYRGYRQRQQLTTWLQQVHALSAAWPLRRERAIVKGKLKHATVTQQRLCRASQWFTIFALLTLFGLALTTFALYRTGNGEGTVIAIYALFYCSCGFLILSRLLRRGAVGICERSTVALIKAMLLTGLVYGLIRLAGYVYHELEYAGEVSLGGLSSNNSFCC